MKKYEAWPQVRKIKSAKDKKKIIAALRRHEAEEAEGLNPETRR